MINNKDEIKEYLNQILCDLTLAARNAQICHWNLKSEIFITLHPYIGDIYDNLNNYIDQVAELMRIYELYPVADLSSCIALSEISEININGSVGTTQAIKILLHDLKELNSTTNLIITFADNNELWDIVQTLSDQVTAYGKIMYFLKNT